MANFGSIGSITVAKVPSDGMSIINSRIAVAASKFDCAAFISRNIDSRIDYWYGILDSYIKGLSYASAMSICYRNRTCIGAVVGEGVVNLLAFFC